MILIALLRLLPLRVDRGEQVEDGCDVSVLALEELGQPAAVVGEAHGQHVLDGSLDVWPCH